MATSGLNPSDAGEGKKPSPKSDDVTTRLLDSIHSLLPSSITGSKAEAKPETKAEHKPEAKPAAAQPEAKTESKPAQSSLSSSVASILAADANPHPPIKPKTETGAKKPSDSDQSILSSFTGGFTKSVGDMISGIRASTVDDDYIKQKLAGKKESEITATSSGMTTALINNAKILAHPVETAKALGNAAVETKDVLLHGTANERASKAGQLAFFGTLLFAGGAAAGKNTASTKALATAEQSAARTTRASSMVGDFKSIFQSGLHSTQEAAELASTRTASTILKPSAAASTTANIGERLLAGGTKVSDQIDNILGTGLHANTGRASSLSTRLEGLVSKPTLGQTVSAESRPAFSLAARAEMPSSTLSHLPKTDLATDVLSFAKKLDNAPHIGSPNQSALKTARESVPETATIQGAGTKVIEPSPLVKPEQAASASKLDLPHPPVQIIQQETQNLARTAPRLADAAKEIESVAVKTPLTEKIAADLKALGREMDDLSAVPASAQLHAKPELNPRIHQLVKDLDTPEVKTILADHPQIQRTIAEVKESVQKLPTVKAELPVVKADVPAVAIDVPAVKSEIPVVKSEIPAVKSEIPAVKGEIPVVKAEIPAAKAEISASNLGNAQIKTTTQDLDRLEQSLSPAANPQAQLARTEAFKDVRTNLERAAANPGELAATTNLQASIKRLEQHLDDAVRTPTSTSLVRDIKDGVTKIEQSAITNAASADARLVVREQATVVARETTTIGKQVHAFNEALDEVLPSSTISNTVNRALGTEKSAVSGELRQIGRTLDEALVDTGKATRAESNIKIQRALDDLDKPELQKFIQENPRLKQVVADMKESGARLDAAAQKIEQQALRIDVLERNQQVVHSAGTLKQQVAEVPRLRDLSEKLSQIERDGVRVQPQVMDDIKQTLTRLEKNGGADLDLANRLKPAVQKLDEQFVSGRRVAQLEDTRMTIATEKTQVARQAGELKDGINAANPAVVRDHIDAIERQALRLNEGNISSQSVARMKESVQKLDELGGAKLFEKPGSFDNLKRSVAAIDDAAVRARGIETFELQNARLIRTTDDLVKNPATANLGHQIQSAATNAEKTQIIRSTREALDDARVATPLIKDLREVRDIRQTLDRLEQSYNYRALEQSATRFEVQSARSVNTGRSLQETLQREAIVSPGSVSKPLSESINQYVRQAENLIARPQDRAAILRDLDRAGAQIERELTRAPLTGQVSNQVSTQFAQLKAQHQELITTARQSHDVAAKLIDGKIERIEQGLTLATQSPSSIVRRENIARTTDDLQDVRHLETHTLVRSNDKLQKAQHELVLAANDLEVAAYRKNLVRMAGEGSKEAADKLLMSGLTSQGYRINTLSNTFETIKSRLSESITARTNMMPVIGTEGGRSIARLSASDAVFANNRLAVFNPKIYNVAAATTGVTSLGTLAYAAYQKSQETQESGEQRDFTPPLQHKPNFEQVIMRQAATEAYKNVTVGGVSLRADDPDFDRKQFNLKTYGQLYFPVKGAEAPPAPAANQVMFTAQSVGIKTITPIRSNGDNHEKPATTQFSLPQAQSLANPNALLHNVLNGRGEPLNAVKGLPGMGGRNNQSAQNDARQIYSTAALSAYEHMESTEDTGLDGSNANNASATTNNASATTNNASATTNIASATTNNDPDQDNGNAGSTVAVPISANTAPAAKRVPVLDQMQGPAQAKAPVGAMAGPPRKRQ